MAAYIIITVIAIILIITLLTMLRVRRRYRKLSRDLSGLNGRKDGKCKSQVLNIIINEYKTVSVSSKAPVNTQAIIEKNLLTYLRGLGFGERFVKNSVSLMVILGLLGTFYGLSLSVGELIELLSVNGNENILTSMESIIVSLISAVSGMSVAFLTSLAGIASSIIVTVFGIVFNIEEAKQALLVEIEEYLDNTVELELVKYKESEFNMMHRAMVSSLSDFTVKMEEILKSNVAGFGEKLALASCSIESSSKNLENTIMKFEEALATFRDNTRDFSEFNYNLRSNIERMDVSFSNLNESLRDTAKLVTFNQNLMNEFTEAVQLVSITLSKSDRLSD